jgi:serine/threonine protein kinase
VHIRDIKPQNMLKSKDGVVKLADFGTAVLTGGDDGSVVLAAGGTPAFMAPELFQVSSKDSSETHDRVVSPQVDVWGLGATLYNLVIGNPPWMAKNQIQLADMVKTIELRFPFEKERHMDPHMKHLIKRMLDKDPKTRITMVEICDHDWVTREGSEPLDEDYLYNLLSPANLASLGISSIDKAIFHMNNNNSFTSPATHGNASSHHSIGSLAAEYTDQNGFPTRERSITSTSINSTSTSINSTTASHASSTSQRQKPLLNISTSYNDVDELPPDSPRLQRLPSTKYQEFVVKKTEIQTESGPVVTGVMLTNNKFCGSSPLHSSTLSNWNSTAVDRRKSLARNLSVGSMGSSIATEDSEEDGDEDGNSSNGSKKKASLMRKSKSLSAHSSMSGRSFSLKKIFKSSFTEKDFIPEDDNNSDSDSDSDDPFASCVDLGGTGVPYSRHGSTSTSVKLHETSPKLGKKLKKKKVVKQVEEDSSDDEVSTYFLSHLLTYLLTSILCYAATDLCYWLILI